ncbi:MAG: response regulator transcription factor [Chthoniobacterales bacterium]|nr:response regulator transcription factor [Chthoniobacterales bacterium]
MRVLIADDQRDVGVALAALVESCGHQVLQVVGSGLEAIQAYTRLKPDVVLMDFSMPRLNGATASRMILSKDPAAKIVIVTAAPKRRSSPRPGPLGSCRSPWNSTDYTLRCTTRHRAGARHDNSETAGYFC